MGEESMPGESARNKKNVAWNTSGSVKEVKLSKAKKYFGHCGLFLGLIIYTAAGAWVFQKLEYEPEKVRNQMIKDNLIDARLSFIEAVNTTKEKVSETLEGFLKSYELKIDSLLGTSITDLINSTVLVESDWNYMQSAFFASTVLTTIGYGNLAPRTYWGRIFCVLFALIGIPFTLTVIADLGKLMASVLSYTYKKFKKQFPNKVTRNSSKLSKKLGKSASVGAAVLLLLLYIAAGGGLFTLWESWSFAESFYFCFITMTTIGFGDLVPHQPAYMLICTLYILVGLALTSTIIELVRSQYADSWRKMRELSTRLQGLSGPLAETLRKYGDNINLDVNVLQDLKDLKKALAMSSGRMKREGSIWKRFWENEDGFDMDVSESSEPRLIQIIIYESSV